MEIGWVSGVAIYVVIWWLVLFMVLPWGAARKIDAEDVAEGQDPGAPAKPMMWRKVLATTLIAGVIFAAFYFAATSGLIEIKGD